jgi:hypothetical protein
LGAPLLVGGGLFPLHVSGPTIRFPPITVGPTVPVTLTDPMNAFGAQPAAGSPSLTAELPAI